MHELDVKRARRALERVLECRATERAARYDVATAIRAALDAGVPRDTMAAVLMRDSAAHRELGGIGRCDDDRDPLACIP